MKIVIIGAGIIGISCAKLIQDTYPSFELTVIADKLSPNNTSDGAAGIVFPIRVGTTPQQRIKKWGKGTFDHIFQIIKSDKNAAKMGLSKVHGYYISKDVNLEEPFCADMVPNFKKLSDNDLKHFPKEIRSGYSFTSVFLEGKKCIPWMMEEFQKRGGKIFQSKIRSLNSLEKYNVIVNCSGLGAKELFNDEEMFPISGHIVRVKAPWIKEFIHFDKPDGISGQFTYILPNQETVVLGSRSVRHSDDIEPKEADRKLIIQNTAKFCLSLNDAEIAYEWVGVRPGRKSIRLEKEKKQLFLQGKPTKEITIIHNYGHGENGMTLSWGCAEEVLSLLKECINNNTVHVIAKL